MGFWQVVAALAGALGAQDGPAAESQPYRHVLAGAHDALFGFDPHLLRDRGYEPMGGGDRTIWRRRPGGPVDIILIDPSDATITTRIDGESTYEYPDPELNRRACERDRATLEESIRLRFPTLRERPISEARLTGTHFSEPAPAQADARTIRVTCGIAPDRGTFELRVRYELSENELSAVRQAYEQEREARRAAVAGQSLQTLPFDVDPGNMARHVRGCRGSRAERTCEFSPSALLGNRIGQAQAQVRDGRLHTVSMAMEADTFEILHSLGFWYGRPEIEPDAYVTRRTWRFADGVLGLRGNNLLFIEFDEGRGPAIRR